MSKRLNKYIAFFDYFDKSLIVLSVTIGNISNESFSTVIGALVRMESASFAFQFFGISELLKTAKRQQEIRKKSIILLKLLC